MRIDKRLLLLENVIESRSRIKGGKVEVNKKIIVISKNAQKELEEVSYELYTDFTKEEIDALAKEISKKITGMSQDSEEVLVKYRSPYGPVDRRIQSSAVRFGDESQMVSRIESDLNELLKNDTK
jgi:hypothetical protein